MIDEAQHLGDDFFEDLSGFLNYAFDRVTLPIVWLCVLPSRRSRLDLEHHASLRARVIAPKTLRPKTRDELLAMIQHGLKLAEGDLRVIAEPALEVLLRASRGVSRTAANLLRAAMMLAHHRDQGFVDEDTMLAVCDELELIKPKQPRGAGAA